MKINQIENKNRLATRQTLLGLFSAGIASVKGDVGVSAVFPVLGGPPATKILAVGKAAYAMYLGLPREVRHFTPALVVTKDGHAKNAPILPNLEIIEASHPIPSQRSLYAGKRLQSWIQACTSTDRLLFLVSGGASSLVEVLRPGLDLDDLIASTASVLADGSPIEEINQRRIAQSCIKGGQLLAVFPGESVEVLAVSDVSGDDVQVIGSGIAAYKGSGFAYRCQMTGSNKVAREAVSAHAVKSASPVIRHNSETLYGDITEVADLILSKMNAGPDGLYIFGGEPTVNLPENPGQGGRNQGLALLLAQRIVSQPGLAFVVGGTDGSDGVTNAAGAFVDHLSFNLADCGVEAITKADSGRFFHLTGDQIVTGPTGTNVMDLVIGLKNTSEWITK